MKDRGLERGVRKLILENWIKSEVEEGSRGVGGMTGIEFFDFR